uniref:Uncharacterized protein n=1 Tax=Cucumis melo TaxID=3656 RepID=A0A9I9EFI3_CUCME
MHTPLSFFKISPLTNDEQRTTKTLTLTLFFSSPRRFFSTTKTHGEETHIVDDEFLIFLFSFLLPLFISSSVHSPTNYLNKFKRKYIDGFVKYIIGYVMKHFGSLQCEIKAKGDFMAKGGSFEKKRMKMNDLDDTLYPFNSGLTKKITNKILAEILMSKNRRYKETIGFLFTMSKDGLSEMMRNGLFICQNFKWVCGSSWLNFLPLIMFVLLMSKTVGDAFNEGLYEEQAELKGIPLLE